MPRSVSALNKARLHGQKCFLVGIISTGDVVILNYLLQNFLLIDDLNVPLLQFLYVKSPMQSLTYLQGTPVIFYHLLMSSKIQTCGGWVQDFGRNVTPACQRLLEGISRNLNCHSSLGKNGQLNSITVAIIQNLF